MSRCRRRLLLVPASLGLVLIFAGVAGVGAAASDAAASAAESPPAVSRTLDATPTLLAGPELVYRLAQFVEWPPHPEQWPRPSFTVCLAGEDPHHVHWAAVLARRHVSGLVIAIRRVSSVTQMHDCHVLHIGLSLRDTTAHLLRQLAHDPVLTVASFPGFSAAGGIVELPSSDKRRLLTLNVEAARGTGLILNQGILSIAAVRTPESE